jgi:hypothetical protein
MFFHPLKLGKLQSTLKYAIEMNIFEDPLLPISIASSIAYIFVRAADVLGKRQFMYPDPTVELALPIVGEICICKRSPG